MSSGFTKNDTMVSHRETPWHGLGTVVEDAPNIREAIVLAGLDWEVELLQVQAVRMVEGGGIQSPEGMQPVRPMIPQRIDLPNRRVSVIKGTDHVLGDNLSAKYKVVQNVEAFSFVESLVDADELLLETAGSLHDRTQIFLSTYLPGNCKIAGEEIRMYVLLTTSHDGSGALRVTVTPVRVVCANTQAMALASFKSQWSMRHTESIDKQIKEARSTLQLTTSYQEEFVRMMERMALADLTQDQAVTVVNDIWEPKDENLQVSEVGASVLANLELSPTIPDEMRTTAYGLYNAATEYLDYKQTFRSSERNIHEQRFDRLDKNAKVKTDLAERLLELV